MGSTRFPTFYNMPSMFGKNCCDIERDSSPLKICVWVLTTKYQITWLNNLVHNHLLIVKTLAKENNQKKNVFRIKTNKDKFLPKGSKIVIEILNYINYHFLMTASIFI